MNKKVCPRCGEPFSNWQPVHISCFIKRGKIFFLGLIILLLMISIVYALPKIIALNKQQSNIYETHSALSQITATQIKVSSATNTSFKTPTLSSRLPSVTVTRIVTPNHNLIQKTTTPSITLTPTFDWTTCHADYVTRIKIGDIVYVSYTPPYANNVRSKPYKDSTLLGKIQPGEEVTIINGPSCSNGWIWWKIQTKNNQLSGWTSEGDAEDYWLVPRE